MKGLMQDWPLLTHTILDHAARWHPRREVVSRLPDGSLHRTTYGQIGRRARMLARICAGKLGIRPGDVVATMAWNGYRHMESWYALMGLGAVVHTLNPRLFADQLDYIINHAGDSWVFLDADFAPVFQGLAERLPRVKGYVVLCGRDDMPDLAGLGTVICYEDLIAQGDAGFAWPRLDENAACGMCYTSGTTGNPKGVVYSHRSTVLHALAICSGDAFALSNSDAVMPVVPMFHANAWSLIFCAPMVGAKLVLPGARMDGASIYELLDGEKVTFTAAVPTVWLMLLQHLEAHKTLRLDYLNKVTIGGAACPESIMRAFEKRYGATVIHAWGMTEMSPIGTLGVPHDAFGDMSDDEWWSTKMKQGRPIYTVDMKITGEDGQTLPRDGQAFGNLKVQGPGVSGAYFKGDGAAAFDDDGWFDTGDVATIDPLGYMQITDRSKDVIKSGGEWISSIDLENIAMSCPGVAEAAAIAMPHPKWDERPLLVVVKKPGGDIDRDRLLAFMTGKIAKWWLPDDVAFVKELPHTGTGKVSKRELRKQFADYVMPRTGP